MVLLFILIVAVIVITFIVIVAVVFAIIVDVNMVIVVKVDLLVILMLLVIITVVVFISTVVVIIVFIVQSPCKGYSLGKILSLGLKLKMPKTSEKPFFKNVTVVLCKKRPLDKTPNIREMRQFGTSATLQRL